VNIYRSFVMSYNFNG